MLNACKYTQDELLEVKSKEPTKVPVMTTMFNPSNPDIKHYIHKNWNIIENSAECADTFATKPIIGFKRLPNLRDMLTKASISYPPKEIEPPRTIPTHCTRLGRCTYCPIINKIDLVTCKITGKKYKPIDLTKTLSCELSDIVYLITCKKCLMYYVGETSRAFRSTIYEHKLSVKNPRIIESPLYPNISLELVTLLGTCSSLSWNGALPNTELPSRLTGEGVSNGGCGILELSIQLA